MEIPIPIQVAVRVYPKSKDNKSCLQTITNADARDNNQQLVSPIIEVADQTFPVTYLFEDEIEELDDSNGPSRSVNNEIYTQCILPMLSTFLEGFDISIVTYGQSCTGKTYTLYGDNMNDGIVQKFIYEIFTQLSHQSERNYFINIGWTEVNAHGDVKDILNNSSASLVQCFSIEDTIKLIQCGLNNRTNNCHNILSLILEQQWINVNGLNQHRLSTISFCDLIGTERLFVTNQLNQYISIPKDVGLQTLEEVINSLINFTFYNNHFQNANQNNQPHPQYFLQYNQTTLTTLLKDSFGGRAQTLVLFCVGKSDSDMNETVHNLQLAFKMQSIINYVVMNTFTDNNQPVINLKAGEDNVIAGRDSVDEDGGISPNVGLQFATDQWMKLLKNAEGLFSKLIINNEENRNNEPLTMQEREQIEEWLYLKAECDDCINVDDIIKQQQLEQNENRQQLRHDHHNNYDNHSARHGLGPIQEELDENSSSCPEIYNLNSSENDEESESEICQQVFDIEDKIDDIMINLQEQTDILVKDKYYDYLKTHPKSVFDSIDDTVDVVGKDAGLSVSSELNDNKMLRRRRSIQPGESILNSTEIELLNQVVAISSTDSITAANKMVVTKQDVLKNNLKISIANIDTLQQQIGELEHTIKLKQNLIADLIKNNETRTTAKQKFNKKKSKLEQEYEKTKKQLQRAILNNKDKVEIERLKALITHIEQRLQDLVSIKNIAGESGQKVKKIQHSLQDSKKQLETFQKSLKKEIKNKNSLTKELEYSISKNNSNANKIVGTLPPDGTDKNKIKTMTARISHIEHVLKEKSSNLERGGSKGLTTNNGNATGRVGVENNTESLRLEIRNLRGTRDVLLDQHCSLNNKLKQEKMLSLKEERKLLECDEAIEAIDAAIELKNELICGRKSVDTDESLQREKGEQMLMARLNKLSMDEMRTLLYKYFQKVIDLKDSSKKLEQTLKELETEKEAWDWRERILTNAVRQARLENDRNVILLQKQHENKLNLLLRHFANETTASSSLNEKLLPLPSSGGVNSLENRNADIDLDFIKSGGLLNKQLAMKATANNNLGLYQLPGSSKEISDKYKEMTRYKTFEKIKEKEQRESKNKLFAKFQVLTRYQKKDTQPSTLNVGAIRSDDASLIPQHNLKQLQTSNTTSVSQTKVTRQKNKLIIQQSGTGGHSSHSLSKK